jgi:hypothetical protein
MFGFIVFLLTQNKKTSNLLKLKDFGSQIISKIMYPRDDSNRRKTVEETAEPSILF